MCLPCISPEEVSVAEERSSAGAGAGDGSSAEARQEGSVVWQESDAKPVIVATTPPAQVASPSWHVQEIVIKDEIAETVDTTLPGKVASSFLHAEGTAIAEESDAKSEAVASNIPVQVARTFVHAEGIAIGAGSVAAQHEAVGTASHARVAGPCVHSQGVAIREASDAEPEIMATTLHARVASPAETVVIDEESEALPETEFRSPVLDNISSDAQAEVHMQMEDPCNRLEADSKSPHSPREKSSPGSHLLSSPFASPQHHSPASPLPFLLSETALVFPARGEESMRSMALAPKLIVQSNCLVRETVPPVTAVEAGTESANIIDLDMETEESVGSSAELPQRAVLDSLLLPVKAVETQSLASKIASERCPPQKRCLTESKSEAGTTPPPRKRKSTTSRKQRLSRSGPAAEACEVDEQAVAPARCERLHTPTGLEVALAAAVAPGAGVDAIAALAVAVAKAEGLGVEAALRKVARKRLSVLHQVAGE